METLNSFCAKFQTIFCLLLCFFLLFFLTNYHYEQSHLELCCLQISHMAVKELIKHTILLQFIFLRKYFCPILSVICFVLFYHSMMPYFVKNLQHHLMLQVFDKIGHQYHARQISISTNSSCCLLSHHIL